MYIYLSATKGPVECEQGQRAAAAGRPHGEARSQGQKDMMK